MKNVKDIYALSPMQEVMLLHAASRSSTDVLFNQFCYEIRGALDPAAFESAWRDLVHRHEILRSAFLWENLKAPVQLVRETVDVPFVHADWSADTAARQGEKLQQFRQADKASRFDPRRAPLMRFALIRCSDDSHYFVWSSHHLLLDRWCLRSLFEELFELYRGTSTGTTPDLSPPVQYRNYINWIRQQDSDRARSYWRTALGGLASATPVTRTVAGSPGEDSQIAIGGNELVDLRRQAKAAGVTPSVITQACWSLVQNQLGGQQDLVFGTVVAGRPSNLPGVESIIGSFVNNVPTRVRLAADTPLGEWLHTLQQMQHQRSQFEYASPSSIQRWSDLPVGQPMFDTLIVTLGQTGVPEFAGFEVLPFPGEVETAYPLTLSVDDTDDELAVHARLQPGRACDVALDELMTRFTEALRAVASAPLQTPLGALPGFRGRVKSIELVEARPATKVEPAASPAAINTQGGREVEDTRVVVELLRSEWQAALGRSDFGLRDDFFELGGSSLQAASLHARLEAATRRSIPMLALFRSTTLEGMAATLASGDWPLRTDIAMGLKTTGSRPPLFCIASPEVNAVGYALLTRHLDDDQPVYVLQTPPADDALRRLSPREIPELATTYLAEVRKIQPHGPYRLLGMCVGAQLVLEMARQLDDNGEQATFAGVINTWALFTISRRYRLQQVFNTFGWYGRRLRQIIALPPREQLPTIGSMIRRRVGGLLPQPAPGNLESSPRSGENNAEPPPPALAPSGSSDGERRWRRDPWIEEYGWSEKDPGDRKYAGEITVFRQRFQPFWRTGDRDLGWGRHAERTNVVPLPGLNHLGILREPVVRVVAKKLTEQLDTAHEKDIR